MKRNLLVLTVCGFVAAAAGCGLDEYERKMVRAQERAQSYDEASLVLGDPIEPPRVVDNVNNKVMEVDAPLFLRPPRTLGSKPRATVEDKQIYRYGPPGLGIPQNASSDVQVALGLVKNMYVAATVTPRGDLGSFAREVLQPWGQAPDRLDERAGVAPAGADEYLGLEFDDAVYSYSAFFVSGKKPTGGLPTMVAVMFQIDKGRRDAVRRLIDLTAEWTALNDKAAASRSRFEKGNKSKGGPSNASAAPPVQPTPPVPAPPVKAGGKGKADATEKK